MQALDALHANVDEFLDRNKLLDEAKSNLSKKRPKGTEWISADNLPKLHWQDSGKQLDSQIVEWWIVQSIQQKSPTCGPIIKRYLSMCRDKDVTSLATWALSTWIAQDTATLSSELAAEKARQEADRLWPIYSVHKYYTDHFKNDKENLYKELYSKFSTDFVGSAIEQKGMLALAAAGGDADTVKACEKYIRTYFGNKLSQCKSLIDVLACLDNPLALQSLLSIANRFRTKAIKQHAQEQVQAVAEAKGWTIEELADRTIPDGGFERPVDDNGDPIGDKAVLELDYGPRQFIVQLNEQLEPIISAKGESKALKALPSPGKSDDPEKAAEAKKAFTDAKKIAKEVVKRQSERLYEALCTQRAWRFHDWLRFLAQHPIVGSLCTRLVWAAFSVPTKGQTTEDHDSKTARQLISCFRPLEGGSLTNENDESVSLTDDALVYLAHTCNISAELGEKWTKHFEDYDVTALFQQFGRSTYELPENLRNSTEITDFEGHSISTFKLRGKATKLAYVRGEAEDGGCFCVYRKSFASLGIQTVLEFTGSFLPEQDISAALINLHFLKLQEGKPGAEWQASKLPLGKIPPVLLSECYNDLKQIAAEGAGFDPDWRAKSYF